MPPSPARSTLRRCALRLAQIVCGLGLLSPLSGCGEPLTARDSWELIGLNSDGSVLDARFTTTDAGLLRGQGYTRFDWVYRKDQLPIQFDRDTLPASTRLDGDGARFGPDALRREGDQWSLSVSDEAFSARLTLTPEPGPAFEQERPEGRLRAEVLSGGVSGFLRAGAREALVDGRAILLRRSEAGWRGLKGSKRQSIYVMGEGVSVAVDQQGGDALAWIAIGGVPLQAHEAVIRPNEKGQLVADFRPEFDLVLQVRPTRRHLQRRPWESLYALERALLRPLTGEPSRRVRLGTATLNLSGAVQRLPAISVIVQYD